MSPFLKLNRDVIKPALLGACAFFLGMVAAAIGQDVAPLPMLNPTEPAELEAVTEADIESDLLTRGPVHEAYAEQYADDPEPGILVTKQPPELIEELPPEEMPEGANVEWIPGYWAWDEDLDDFIWISGLWRDIPAGQRWVPGYWAEVDDGFRWVPGFWTSSETDELTYLPEPPESLEQGPNVAAPSESHFWVPGTWSYQTNNYAWRPGYWTQGYDNYVWIPARYQWTPRGYIHCGGYWDYPVARRGVLYSPVHFRNRRIPYRYRGYRYRPRIVVSAGPLLVHLFVRPAYRHYYFGDYYAPRYRDRGIYPFTQLNRYARRGYYHDPLRSYYQVAARRTTYDRLVDWNRYFNKYESVRPPRTYRDSQQFFASHRNTNTVVVQQATLATTINILRDRSRPDHRQFRNISLDDRTRISRDVSSAVRELTSGRLRFEQQDRRGGNGAFVINNGRVERTGDRDQRNPGGRDQRQQEVVSLKLPEVAAFRDRIRTEAASRGININGRDQRSIGSSSGIERNGSDGNAENRGRIYSPSDLRERIEAARRNIETSRQRSVSESAAEDIRRSRDQGRSSVSSRVEEIRNGILNSRGNSAATDRRNMTGRDQGTESARQQSSGNSASDLRSRIEEARRQAEQRRESQTNRTPTRTESTRPIVRPDTSRPDTGRQSDSTQRNSTGSDLRARIEAARKQAEQLRQSRSPSTNRNQSAQPTPERRSSSADRNSSGTDLRSRIEAARRAMEQRQSSSSNRGTSQAPKVIERNSSSTTTQPKRSSSSSIDLQKRMEAARQAAARQAADRQRQLEKSRQQQERDQARDSRKSSTSSSRKSSQPAQDLRSRIEAARKSMEAQRAKSSASRTQSSRSSSSKSASDAKARIDAARKAAEARAKSRAQSSSKSAKSTPSRSSSKPSSAASRSDRSREIKSRIESAIKKAREKKK